VQGIDLFDLLERRAQLPVDVAAIIALQVARALDYAHFRGIVHRDVKPANIMISRQGEVKLMDFGIARDDSMRDLTETGTGLGTPSYMSPEQILGDKLDFRSDLFSVGIVLYQMVTGQKPFIEDDARTVMQKIRLDRFVSPRKLNPKVPRQLERILGRCMEKVPANRYPTTQALIDDLMEFLSTRVPMNYNARLILYLRDIGVITDKEADAVLEAGAPKSLHRGPADRTLVSHVAFMQIGLLLALLGGGGAIQAAAGRLTGDPTDFVGETGNPLVPDRAGHLRIVVDPWADVLVDGQKVATTPTANPIAHSPGRHFLKLENPYFVDAHRDIRIRTNETLTIEVELEPEARSSSDDGVGERDE
jgi:serine/threonine-protein kinase